MVLLIGATGFLGPPVLKKLLKKGYEVNCLIRTSSDKFDLLNAAKLAGKKILLSTGTLESGDSIISAIKKADSVIYMIDLKHTHLLETFLNTVRRTGVKRVVFISSTTVLLPLESKIKNQKINSENLIKNSGLDYTILRPSMIYGSKDDINFSKMIRFIKKKGFFTTFGNGNNLIQPIYIEDVAEAAANVLDNKKTYGKIYNIAGKNPLKYNDMLDIIRSKLKMRFKVIKLPIKLSKFLISIYAKISKNPSLTPDQIERMGIDKAYSYQKARADFNFSPVSFENGIEKLIRELEVKK
jgi:nucleoside-diphosphate-sugar epimerase